ncbi:hypothetical protein [Streptomyces anulatus]|uniref:hypothetical protein n=1 Tax=Streptomyces anulatus TaxID=1892 RepID=UPI0036B946E4
MGRVLLGACLVSGGGLLFQCGQFLLQPTEISVRATYSGGFFLSVESWRNASTVSSSASRTVVVTAKRPCGEHGRIRSAPNTAGTDSRPDRAGTEAWASARAFAQDVIAPQQQIVVEAEAGVRELAARLEQNTEHLRELTELTGLREQLPKLQELKEAAEAAYTAARNDTDLMVKQGTDRWSDHLLRRMQACDPEITTASVSPEDFSVTVNGGAFDSTVVTGHGRTRINVSTLLALRDTAQEVPAMPVPQFLMVDSPFTGLGNSPKDQRTGTALLDGLTELATSQHPSGTGGQVIIACTELLGPPQAAVREIRTSLADGAIPGLPPRDSDTP